jgi:hypothetical protein
MQLIEIANNNIFEYVKIFVNGELIAKDNDVPSLIAKFDCKLPVVIDMEFSPFGIKPIVRFNNFLLNYWLADILLQDHKLSFTVTEHFYNDYKNKDIQGRLTHLNTEEKSTENVLDKYVGINNLYPTLVDSIKNLITK